ncbi:helix-turn-helix domain-containing protein [Halostagnicola kamekurae]|uniref:GAF and HTH_10 associated domain-containing protein n=1 Tax=Halostagnicola kamekurae TaxID=619731 RepID=A0A1I6QU98_9EURY|nr:helix-turn-helix domain-containing protein [Halostagnicola kamekurae]SFS56023.1 GAF and HTH_10 associated domain-containing protein [Halostagnicola kamekurae]
MASIADIELAASETSLGDVFDALPALFCEMEQAIASSNRTLWLSGATAAEIESALEEASSIRTCTQIGGGDDRWLFDIGFDPQSIDIFDIVDAEGGTVLSASAAKGMWRFSVRFREREAIATFYEHLRSVGLEPTIVRLFDPTTEMHTRYGLTTQQYHTLLAAVERGYFEIPRKITMQELSDELGVSHQALSEQLRRAYRALVTAEFETSAGRGDAGFTSPV